MSMARRLTSKQLRELERELRGERARLERAMLAEGGDASGEMMLDAPLRAPTDADGGVAIALETRVAGRHPALVDALRRIENGTYGDCASCERPIPYGRLLAMPEATRCVSCAGRI